MNNNRALFVIFCVLGFFVILTLRLFNIQVTRHEDYAFYAKNQQMKTTAIRGERGFVYDRNNEVLAYDRNDVSFYIDIRMTDSASKCAVADTFAAAFHKSKEYYANLMKGSSKIVCLEKKASPQVSVLFRNFVRKGFFFKEDPTRVYSYDNLASHILGYVDKDYKGAEGIEKMYDKKLTGEDGKLIVERDVMGRMITVSSDATIQPVHGENLVLTIDKAYQKILEEELKNGIKEFQAESATAIMMDPNNGEILGLANYPDFNPNSFSSFSDEARRNRALTDTYEPGSTFKSISLSALLDQNLVRENESVYAENGLYRFMNTRITDSHQHGNLTVREIIEQSSNIGMAKLISRIDKESFYKYLRNFGFGNYTSIDLPGETKGLLKKPQNFTPTTEAFMSFGYQVSVTPIQITSAYAALINGGYLYQPHIVKKISLRNGEVVEEFTPKLLRNVISENTSNRIKNLLVGVVENGTGKTAKIEDVLVGGKTGTAQRLKNNRYVNDEHNSSFVGFFPADNPKFLCYIMVINPRAGHYGGVVAGPIFKNIAQRLLALDMNLMSSSKSKSSQKNTNTIDKKIADSDIKFKAAVQYTDVPEGQVKSNQARPKILNKNLMPDLTSYRLRDALAVLTELGVKCTVSSGSGKIIWQSIQPGSQIKSGLTCQIKCEEKKITGARID